MGNGINIRWVNGIRGISSKDGKVHNCTSLI